MVRASPDCNATTLAVSGVSGVVESRRPNCPHSATALFGVISTDAVPICKSALQNRGANTIHTNKLLHVVLNAARSKDIFMLGSFDCEGTTPRYLLTSLSGDKAVQGQRTSMRAITGNVSRDSSNDYTWAWRGSTRYIPKQETNRSPACFEEFPLPPMNIRSNDQRRERDDAGRAQRATWIGTCEVQKETSVVILNQLLGTLAELAIGGAARDPRIEVARKFAQRE